MPTGTVQAAADTTAGEEPLQSTDSVANEPSAFLI